MRPAEHGGIFFRLIVLLTFLAFAAFLYVVRHPLLRLAGESWVIDEPAEHADVILVLGDDNYAGDRAVRAAQLYRAGLAPQIVASGRLLRPYAGIAEMIERDLEVDGVPAASIVKFSHRSANTREEAEALAGLVANHGWKTVLVVTSNYHTRRARFIFGRVFPSQITVRTIAARDSEFDPSKWWETRLGKKLFLNEILGYAVSRWELRQKGASSSGGILLPFSLVRLETDGSSFRFSAGMYPVSNWKHAQFTEVGRCTIVRCLPSSPGCPVLPGLMATEFRLGVFHVA